MQRSTSGIDPDALARFKLATGIGSEDLAIVARLPLFAGLKGSSLIDLLASASVRGYPRNAVLFVQDEPAVCFFVVLDGWVKLYRETVDGHESVIGVFTSGESFAEAAIFQSGVYPVNASVAEDARLLIVPAGPFLQHLSSNPELYPNILGSMSIHLRRLVQQIEQLTVRSSAQRLADFLLRLIPPETDRAILQLPWDKALVAARLGMQPETLSRSLAKLRSLGVETKGAHVTIRNMPTLREFSSGDRS
jgi:CRP-like cAMP-binding protein